MINKMYLKVSKSTYLGSRVPQERLILLLLTCIVISGGGGGAYL